MTTGPQHLPRPGNSESTLFGQPRRSLAMTGTDGTKAKTQGNP